MKNIKKLLVLSLMLIFALPFTARSEGITVTLDGRALQFDVPPQLIDDRTLVPMRSIFEAMGATVDWDEDTQTITASGDLKVIQMTIGKKEMTISEGVGLIASIPDASTKTATIELDVPPQLIDDRTLVPVRAVAESFDAKVDWNGDTQTVIIESAVTISEPPIPDNTPEPAPTETPAPTQGTDLIEYDESLEPTVGYMKNFRILSAELNSDGNYDITYTLQTYLEGRGDVGVSFNCFDSNGKLVDSWSKLYHGTDYTWSDHTVSVTISGATAKIQLAP